MASLRKRGQVYYAQYYIGGKQKRVCLRTRDLKVAKDKLRQIESALVREEEIPLPTKTPIGEIIGAYADHIRVIKTAKSAQTDIYYLRQVFGPVCEQLKIVSRRSTMRAMRRPPKFKDKRRKLPRVEVNCLEDVTTAMLSQFISTTVKTRGLAPKTANRYREILTRLFNWAMKERGVRTRTGTNPAAAVSRYKEHAPRIKFLTLGQISKQLTALEDDRQLQTMVAVYIYAGLRREELLWVQFSDMDFHAGQYGLIRIRPKEIDGEFWQPKTKRNRAVPISSKLRMYLDRYEPRITPSNVYFPSPDGKRWDADNFSADLRKEQLKQGLRWTCGIYRHTFGSQLAMKGESLYKISALMGNSPEICRRHYAAVIPEAMIDTVEFPEIGERSGRRDRGSNTVA